MIYEKLTEEECYLYALITDESGIDLAEFCFIDESQEDGCFRAWPFQVPWFRNQAQKHIDAASRSCGKSLSIKLRAFAFPFNYPGEEMVITAPEAVHLQAVTDNVEGLFTRNKLAREMLQGQIKHRPYHMNFVNGSRIMGRIPQRDGTGVQGSLAAGTLILTRDRGLIPVEEVTTDDHVWSHEKRWSEVCSTYELPEQTRYRVKGQGAFELSVNADHRFYTRNDISSMPGKKKRKLGEFTWEYANDLRSSKYQAINSYWTGATDFGQPLGVPIIDFSKADTSFILDKDFWWITGRYIADGSSNRGCVDIFAHPKDHDEITDRLDRMGATYSIKEREHSSADRIRITNMPYGKWLRKYFKHHSTTKELPTWCLTMSAQWRSALLDGYLSGDGSDNPHGNQVRRASTSVSKKLTLGMGLLAGSLGYNIGFGHNDNVKTTHICGTELKNPARDKYLLRLNRHGEGVFDRDGFSSYKIRSVVEDGTAKFYGISVADGSYLADGVFHHNTHPLILEQDEASSYPEAGWTEIKETVKIQNPRARWRCIAEDQNVLTKDGWKVIQDVQIGDEVWTHKNRWRKVLNVFDNGYADCVKIVGQGIDGLIATENHKLYTRTRKRRGGLFEDSKWITSEEIIKNKNYQSSWASPVFTIDPDLAPSMEKLSSGSIISNTNDHVWLWLYGLFIAEGYTTDFKHGHSRHRRAYWCLHDDEAPYVASLLQSLGLKTSYDSGKGKSTKVCVQNASVAQWLKDEAGSLANNKGIARWVYGLDNKARQQVLNGLNYGDGSFSDERTRWEYFTVSHKLALDVKLLAQSLDYVANIRYVPPHLGEIEGRVINCAEGWTVQMRKLSEYKLPQTFKLNDNLFWSPIEAIEESAKYHVYDLEVEEDHSYVVEGIIVSNCHGVSFGIGGTFNQNISGKNSTWTVTRLPAMYRPNWTEKERRDKIEEYGGYDSSGYRRNILGLPADAGSPMFVAHRLMAVTDSNLDSEYNTIDYYNRTIDEAQIRDLISGNIEDLIKIPVLHGRYKKTWIGMDLGWTESPSSIVVFAEDKHPKKQETVLKLITRLLLRKVSPEDQVKAIIYLMNLYRPMAYALDATGAGFPLIDNLRAQVRQNDELSYMLGRIKDCQFSTKVIVGFDPDIEIDEYDPEGYLKAAIMRPFIEASTDAIRLLVDSGNIILPYDRELIDELQATPGTTKQIGNTLDAYGRSSRKQGMHNLDAMRMALFTWQTHFIDEMIESHKQIWTPPAMITY